MSLTERVLRMSISDAKEVVRMVKAEVTGTDDQRFIDSVQSGSTAYGPSSTDQRSDNVVGSSAGLGTVLDWGRWT